MGVSKTMEKMENIVFDRNYEEDKPDPLAQAIFDRVNAPGGFLEEFSKKMDAIPKVIVPKDKENYEDLLERCDEFAKRHHGKIHGVVDFEHWDAHIDLTLPMLEFDDSEDILKRKTFSMKSFGRISRYFLLWTRRAIIQLKNQHPHLFCRQRMDSLAA